MIRRVYIKLIYFIDVIFATIFRQVEIIGFLKPIQFKLLENKKDILKVSHSYPLNFNKSDENLFNEWKEYNTFENKLFELENVSITFRGIVFKGFQSFVPALPHPFFKTEFGFMFLLGQKLFKKNKTLDNNKKYILIYDFWSCANYYHWMIDSLSRMIEWEAYLGNYILLIPENSPKYITDTISLFEFNGIECISKNSYVTVSKLIVPNYCAWSGQQHPQVLKKLKDLLVENYKQSNNFERIYVSRSRQKNRKISNESELISILKQHQFEIIYFEGMSVHEQISIVLNAKIFITSHGANVTNALFGKNITVLELLRNDKPNFCYWSALSCLNIPYYYQLCKVVNHDDLFVDLKSFEENLKLILK